MIGAPAPTYPKRPQFFSFKFLKLLASVSAANVVGADGCWLLTMIVTQEDTVHYRPVDFFNGQLLPLLGVASEDTLARLRAKLVNAGWLHYRAGSKGVPGVYWVCIPERYQDLFKRLVSPADTPADSPVLSPATVRGEQTDTPHGCGGKQQIPPQPCGGKCGTTSPFPKDTPESAAAPPARRAKAKQKTTAKWDRPAKPRPPNPLFDAVAEVCGKDPSIPDVGSMIGKVAASLGKADPPYTPDEVREFGRRFLDFCPYAARDIPPRDRPTPGELLKNIDAVRRQPARLPTTPRSASESIDFTPQTARRG